MIKLERFEVMNMNNAIRGARNPLNSWARMDSYFDEEGKFVFGPNDLDLAKRLCKAGSDHRKFIRQIFVTVDITAPLYWWKEYDLSLIHIFILVLVSAAFIQASTCKKRVIPVIILNVVISYVSCVFRHNIPPCYRT